MTSFHLDRDKRAALDEAAALVTDGALVALGGGLCARLPMALVRALIRLGRRDRPCADNVVPATVSAHERQWRCSIDERFVVALARTVHDREVVFHGLASPCAQVAMHVARRTHAPDCLLVEGATYAVNPEPVFIPPTSNDLALHQGAVYRMTFEEFFDAACRGDVDRMFLSGGQIDGWGNTNVTAIGPDPSRPKIKLGGGGGGCNISATIGALTVWTTRHRSGRTLVRDLDVLTDIGHRTPEGDRRELGYPGGGPQWLISELGVFDYADGHARLRALWPDVTLADVAEATGFDLRVDLVEGLLEPPTEAELAAVRAVDPLGVRRLEFGPDELKRTFPCDS